MTRVGMVLQHAGRARPGNFPGLVHTGHFPAGP